jgi:S1-C subfamily serine protease
VTPFDAVVLVLLLAALAVGAVLGLVRAVFSLIGLAIGLIGAFTLTKHWMLSIRPDAVVARNWIFIAGFVGLPLLGWAIGGALAQALRPDDLNLSPVERVTGAVVAGVAMVVLVWLVVPASRTSTVVASWTTSSETSHLLESFPSPPVDVGALIGQDVFPANLANALGVGDVSQPPRDLPAIQDAALQRAEAASVQVVAQSCGAFNWGSGFAVRPDLVATNAHVVAGSNGDVTVIAHGHTADATVVTFDPARDFALLALTKSTLPTLRLDTKAIDPQTPVITLGHPDAQTALDVGPARVVDQKFVEMNDPYGRPVNRATMLLSTANHVRPGSSGGAVIDTDGEVVGVIFAGPHSGTGYAYAIPSEEILPDVNRAVLRPVSAGGCDGLQN